MNSNSWQYMCDYLDGKITYALKNVREDIQTDVMCTYVERSLAGVIISSKTYEKKTAT